MELKKDSIVKLIDGREVMILNLPTSFMANGSYEVAIGDGTKEWINPEEILFEINEDYVDDINNYFEVIMDESGVNLIPKGVEIIDIESDREDMNRVKITLGDLWGTRKHNVINIHVGDSKINDMDDITTKPEKPEEKSKLKKYLDNISNDE
jgi:hypothetical protein